MRNTTDFSIERLVERMRVGARRQRRSAEVVTTDIDADRTGRGNSEAVPSQVTQFQPESLVLQASFTPHPDDRYHVNDLLKYSDRNFIQNAYRAILKRGPDATGYESFIDGLRSGRLNKMDILARLRYSTEGRAKKVRVDGLFFPAAVRMSYQVPILGYLLNLAVGLARLPKSIRHQQQFEAHVLAQQEQIADYANRSHAALVQLAAEVSGRLIRLQESAATISAQQQEFAALAREQLEGFKDEQRRQTEALGAVVEEHRQYLDSFAGEQRDRVTTLAREHRQYLETLAREQQEQAASFAGEQERRMASFVAEQQQDLARTYAQLEHFQTLIDNQRREVETSQLHFREETTNLENRIAKENSERETTLELLAKELRAELAHVFAKQQEIRSELVFQAQRANVLLEKAREQLSGPRGKEYLAAMAHEADHTLDAFYLALEEQFRGSRTEIKDRLKVYLPLIVDAGIGADDKPILDVGCGRGEWLELLSEQGLRATGIDSNRMQVAKSRELGLSVTEAELLSHLRSLPESSLGAVTGFHIVEHLPVESLVALLDETVRVVKSGGAVIFETPNPENVLVGSCNFYFDPTHRNPLPSPVLKFLLESRGFTDVRILKLNPSDEAPVKGSTDIAKRFNQYFYGPMDYAVIGWRV